MLPRRAGLPLCFRNFVPYRGEGRSPGFSHTCEKGCAVWGAGEEGKIASSRHESYVTMYQEVKDIKEWQMKEKSV